MVSNSDETGNVSVGTHEPLEERRTLRDRVFTPRVVLAIFTALNFLTYYDRGAISGSLVVIRDDNAISGDRESLTDTQSGFIVSGFMIGFMITCPLFSVFAGMVPSKWIIVGGMLSWSIACMGTAFANSYVFLLICRIIVGVGEAAYVGFTVTIIDAIAPTKSRTIWIGTFYSMIPVGTAVGMAVGGVVSSLDMIGFIAGWRLIFVVEVIAAIPILLLITFLPEMYNLQKRMDASAYLPIHKAVIALCKNVNYILIVLGYAMYCFVLGAVSVWAIPMLVMGPMHISNTTASIIVGGVTAVSGVFGSIAGGLVLDKLGGSTGIAGTMKCQLFDVLMIIVCIPLGIGALFSKSLWLFIPILVVSVFALFAVTAPVNASILTIVPQHLRPYSMSFSVFFIHFFGDFPSPTFVGFLSDRLFSRGCPKHDYESCLSDTANRCKWMSNVFDSSTGYCTSEFQLHYALLVVFCILSLAIPSWLTVYFLLRRKNTLLRSIPSTEMIPFSDEVGEK